jgi:hypothetical protein
MDMNQFPSVCVDHLICNDSKKWTDISHTTIRQYRECSTADSAYSQTVAKCSRYEFETGRLLEPISERE